MANKEKKEKDVKNKKHFFKDFKAELKKVIWPTPKQLVNNTIAVVVIVIITAAIVFVLDIVFDLFNNYGINKLKAAVRKEDNSIVQVEENTEAENEANEVAEEANNEEKNNEVQNENVE